MTDKSIEYFLTKVFNTLDFSDAGKQLFTQLFTHMIKKWEFELTPTKTDNTVGKLKEFAGHFSECTTARKKFCDQFYDWRTSRRQTVRKLREIAEMIHTHKKNCNISNVTSASVGTVAGAALVASVIFPPLAILTVPATIGATASVATAIGTSAVEISLLQSCLTNAKAVQQADLNNIDSIKGWFESSQKLIDALDQTIGYDTVKKIFLKAKEEHVTKENVFAMEMDEKQVFIKSFSQLCMDIINSDGIKRDGILIPGVLSYLVVSVILDPVKNSVFRCIEKSQFYVDRSVVNDNVTDLYGEFQNKLALEFLLKPCSLASIKSARAFSGVLGGVLSLADVVLTSIDIDNGSVSPYSEELKSLANYMEKQLHTVQTIHDQLCNSF